MKTRVRFSQICVDPEGNFYALDTMGQIWYCINRDYWVLVESPEQEMKAYKEVVATQ